VAWKHLFVVRTHDKQSFGFSSTVLPASIRRKAPASFSTSSMDCTLGTVVLSLARDCFCNTSSWSINNNVCVKKQAYVVCWVTQKNRKIRIIVCYVLCITCLIHRLYQWHRTRNFFCVAKSRILGCGLLISMFYAIGHQLCIEHLI